MDLTVNQFVSDENMTSFLLLYFVRKCNIFVEYLDLKQRRKERIEYVPVKYQVHCSSNRPSILYLITVV